MTCEPTGNSPKKDIQNQTRKNYQFLHHLPYKHCPLTNHLLVHLLRLNALHQQKKLYNNKKRKKKFSPFNNCFSFENCIHPWSKQCQKIKRISASNTSCNFKRNNSEKTKQDPLNYLSIKNFYKLN